MADICNELSKSWQKKWSVIYYPLQGQCCPSTTKNFLTDLILCIYSAYNVYVFHIRFQVDLPKHVQGSCFLLLLFKTVNALYMGSKPQIKLPQELQKNLFADYHVTVILSTFLKSPGCHELPNEHVMQKAQQFTVSSINLNFWFRLVPVLQFLNF